MTMEWLDEWVPPGSILEKNEDVWLRIYGMPTVLRAFYRLSDAHMRCLLLFWFTMYYYFILTNRDYERLSNSSETT